jgi:Tfp pilus assembly ATPase PilU
MQTMDQHLAALVSDGTITMEEAESKAHDLETVRQLVSKPKFGAADQFFSMSGTR